jgi:hypothetical protein
LWERAGVRGILHYFSPAKGGMEDELFEIKSYDKHIEFLGKVFALSASLSFPQEKQMLRE